MVETVFVLEAAPSFPPSLSWPLVPCPRLLIPTLLTSRNFITVLKPYLHASCIAPADPELLVDFTASFTYPARLLLLVFRYRMLSLSSINLCIACLDRTGHSVFSRPHICSFYPVFPKLSPTPLWLGSSVTVMLLAPGMTRIGRTVAPAQSRVGHVGPG